jgi:hypothetical protein
MHNSSCITRISSFSWFVSWSPGNKSDLLVLLWYLWLTRHQTELLAHIEQFPLSPFVFLCKFRIYSLIGMPSCFVNINVCVLQGTSSIICENTHNSLTISTCAIPSYQLSIFCNCLCSIFLRIELIIT